MFGLISPLISLFAGGIPRLLDIWQDSKDKKHELSLAQLQMTQQLELQKAGFQAQKELEEVRLDEIKVQSAADIKQAELVAEQNEVSALYAHDKALNDGAAPWVRTLSASVRPVVTYIFVGELVAVNIASTIWAWSAGIDFQTALDLIFSETEMVMLMDIVMFWFGTRAFKK